MKVAVKNPMTGETRFVKVGWSWTLFLFSGFFGLPLFLRKLNVWGSVFIALWAINFIVSSLARNPEGAALSVVFFFLFLGLQIWLGIKGNEMTAKNYLELGWKFAEPDSFETKYALREWKMAP